MDPVQEPNHYVIGDLEFFDTLRTVYGEDKALGFAIGNVWKYVWRAASVNAKHNSLPKQIQDLNKAAKYIEFAINILEKENDIQDVP